MKLKEMQAVIRLIRPFTTGNSTTSKPVILRESSVEAFAIWGRILTVAETGIASPVGVDGQKLCSIIQSFSGDGLLMVASGSTLSLQCGAARATLALHPIANAEAADFTAHGVTPVAAPPAMSSALALGSISCVDALAVAGLRSVSIDTRQAGLCKIYSSDNRTIAIAELPWPEAPKLLTAVSPEVVDFVQLFLSEKSVMFELGETGMGMTSDTSIVELAYLAIPKQDILKSASGCPNRDLRVPVPKEAATTFVKMVQSLSDDKQNSVVTLVVKDKQLLFQFSDNTTQAERLFDLDAIDSGMTGTAALRAHALATALQKSECVYLDHMDNKVLIFGGSKPQFEFYVAGK